jgi:hypothetical protein
VTSTPEPFTVTPLPTVTSSKPQPPPPKPTNTRAPKPAAPAAPKPTAVAQPPAATIPAPTPTQTNPCGQPYQVAQLLFPHDGDQRDAKAGGGAARTIQFKWTPVAGYNLDPKIGYQIFVKAPKNSAVLYISHNGYLTVQNDNGAILSQQATFQLTLGSDTDVQWNVTVVYSNSGFDDQNFVALGPVTSCGPATGPFTIHLRVME